jgi:hypothetical protein
LFEAFIFGGFRRVLLRVPTHVQLQFRGQSPGATFIVDATDFGDARDEQCFFGETICVEIIWAKELILMFDSSSVAVGQSCSQHKNVIEESRGVELKLGSAYYEHNSSFFNLAVGDRRSP